MTNAKQPDALRLSGLHNPFNILNFKDFVDLVRRSHGIRYEQSTLYLSHAGTWRCPCKDKTSHRRFVRENQGPRH
ncbi:hypothetical protein BW690_15290 [Escherichia coli]|nr:hypothetical protein BW690_15290 [Escherichia coli]